MLTRPNTHQHIGSPTAQGVSSPLRVGGPVRIREEILILLGGFRISNGLKICFFHY